MIKRRVQMLLPGAQVFLDVDDLQSIDDLEVYVASSSVLLTFLSKCYFASRNSQKELREACRLGKPLVRMHEADVDHGGAGLGSLYEDCPADLRHFRNLLSNFLNC